MKPNMHSEHSCVIRILHSFYLEEVKAIRTRLSYIRSCHHDSNRFTDNLSNLIKMIVSNTYIIKYRVYLEYTYLL